MARKSGCMEEWGGRRLKESMGEINFARDYRISLLEKLLYYKNFLIAEA